MTDRFLQTSVLKPPNEFPFPFPPYNIQKDFMKNLYAVLEERKLGIFESPTGTGKSLSLICGVLRWLCDHEVRYKADILKSIALIEEELKNYDDNTDDWLTVQTKQAGIVKYKDEFQLQLKSLSENAEEIENIKKKKSLIPEVNNKNRFAAFSKPENTNSMVDNDVLLDDVNLDEKGGEESEEENDPENEYENVKIYFCSRTHSQLSQFIGEVQKSPYSDTRVVPMASRQTFCVNPDVKKLKNLSLINERCLELQKKKSEKSTKTDSSKRAVKKMKCCSSGCVYKNKNSVDDLKDEIITKIHDVEELVTKGQEMIACPYYATRAAIPLSQLVVIPYNTLLHKSTREASKIKLKNNIVIIDEAHNLLDAIGNMHSSLINGSQLCLCCNQLNQYKTKYEKLFNATSILYLDQLIFVVGRLISIIGGKSGCNPMDSNRKGIDSKVYTLADFVHAAEIDNFNLFKILNFCKRSKLTHKLQGFVEKVPPVSTTTQNKPESGLKNFLQNISNTKNKVAEADAKAIASPSPFTPTEQSNNVILPVIAFIESLTNHCEDGRIICTRQSTVGRGSLKFLLLNPAAHFQEIVKETRSVIVAGGTMQPISEFREQLFQNAGAELSRIIAFSCGHVIPPENILPIIVSEGPSGKKLDFSFEFRNSDAVMNELGQVLNNVCNIVPAGVVCFYPSYEYEQRTFEHFEKSGLIETLAKKKKIFREPKKSCDVDRVLSEYAQFISDSKKQPNRKPNGCLLFSVIGGKLSEGLNFSDDLGRCVIVVGLPYPNIKSAELQEKMNYLDKTAGPGSGHKHYENLCMKAVNQSIGRAVRHKDDYSTVFLLDHRYSREHIQLALPSWMRRSLVTCEKFGTAYSSLNKVSNVNLYS
ncbi:hypothetical protein V9T40_004368 [Parthenolecanium corni]|uniref:Helicase ATP-binding domain-containing protein n=1 Tax=Parthenolecanium corni TaxID=536013 RepID=A0AAN9TRY4_9HEMI